MITNKHSNNVYVGQTRLPVEKRWKTHLSEATHLNKHFKLHQAIRKYGDSAFTVSVLEENLPDRAAANAAEVSWIAALDSYRHGYNMTRGRQYNCGGNTGPNRNSWNLGLTKETDRRLADIGAAISASITPETRKAFSDRMSADNPMYNPVTVAKVAAHPNTEIRHQKARIRMRHSNPMKDEKNRNRMRTNNPNKDGRLSRGRHMSDVTKQLVRSANLVRVCCLRCHTEGGIAAMSRYHTSLSSTWCRKRYDEQQ